MSNKAHAKATSSTPAQEASAPAPQTAADGGTTALVQSASPPAPEAAPDSNHGHGGHYVVIGGERRLVNRVKQPK